MAGYEGKKRKSSRGESTLTAQDRSVHVQIAKIIHVQHAGLPNRIHKYRFKFVRVRLCRTTEEARCPHPNDSISNHYGKDLSLSSPLVSRDCLRLLHAAVQLWDA
eukprot:1157481-Rhodomonas_salina.1